MRKAKKGNNLSPLFSTQKRSAACPAVGGEFAEGSATCPAVGGAFAEGSATCPAVGGAFAEGSAACPAVGGAFAEGAPLAPPLAAHLQKATRDDPLSNSSAKKVTYLSHPLQIRTIREASLRRVTTV